ncbi:MAG TPA: YgaP-like transmembrane domain [Verrucomicrobiae bacterium]|nr:YgaP-like transmembrane domain [Verrucomicrobiae bacterium]
MRKLLTPNITAWGRVVRALWGAALVAAALWLTAAPAWLRITLLVAAGFALFEALRGWCVMRACGIKTKI